MLGSEARRVVMQPATIRTLLLNSVAETGLRSSPSCNDSSFTEKPDSLDLGFEVRRAWHTILSCLGYYGIRGSIREKCVLSPCGDENCGDCGVDGDYLQDHENTTFNGPVQKISRSFEAGFVPGRKFNILMWVRT
jgi:hypothetical protein